MTVRPEFWRGRRVLVTGHTGFKGSWLSFWLQSLAAEVHGYALQPPTDPSLFVACDLVTGMASSTIADVRDEELVLQTLRRVRPEVVFHLAAQPLVRQSYASPVETYSVNVLGTVHLLEAVRRTPGVRAVVNVTTDKCYENREWPWGYRENEPMGGFDPYSSSKGCAELVTSAYRRSFFESSGTSVATARAGNVIGGGDWANDRLVPDIIRSLERREPVRVRNPRSIRPWQHVLEPLSGYLRLAEALHEADGHRFAEAWNFGPEDGDARPVQWVVERLVAEWGDGVSWVLDESPQPHEATCLKLDCSKSRSLLGWLPRWRLSRAVAAVAEWHRTYAARGALREVMLEQISSHQAIREES